LGGGPKCRYLFVIYRNRRLSRADYVLDTRNGQELKPALGVNPAEYITGEKRKLYRFNTV
jgi:hypothetical protein